MSFPVPLSRLPRRLALMIAVLTAMSSNALAQQNMGARSPTSVVPLLVKNGKATEPVAEFRSCSKPVYPKAALYGEQEGTVTLAFLIGSDGAVKEAKVVKSSGFPLLDLAAQEGIRRCMFRPSRIDGKPVVAWTKMQYVWTLDGPTPAEAAAALPAALANAERGDPAAQYKLGSIYMDGDGVVRDPAQAFAWWRKAAEQGHVWAIYSLGAALHFGVSGKPDLAQAMIWYRKAAELNMPEAQHMMGVLTLEGIGVPVDEVVAREWFRRAAMQRLAVSQAYFAGFLLNKNTPDMLAQGIALLHKAAAQDDFTGKFLLAQCYDTGRGVPQDKAMAVTLYEKAALGGSKPAQRLMATMYERGEGVTADPVKATQWRMASQIRPPRPR
ncbi:TonB family protein [Massilia sp. CCM 8695]|uniref:TonB family protein n=1 Tax=Massilia frigida TaxID=2609281 RepID=A0ABX0NC24_9BURK|nr:TonB family protein [Massilia frigida]NHZ82662.1 TonB family protein [Massilia frigida]